MRLIRRIVTSGTLVLMTGLVALPSAVAPSPAAAAYRGDCSDGQKGFAHAIIIRDSTNNWDGVIGDAIVRPLLPCLSPTSTKYSYPLVLPANLEGSASGEIVQIGYSRCGEPGGCGSNWPNDGEPHWVYTPDDDNGGGLTGFTAHASPVIGHRYRFKIEKIDFNTWRFCIRDLTTGGGYQCDLSSRSWSNDAPRAWWGTEVQNTEAAMGPKCCDTDIDMRWMQYHRVSQNDWRVVDGQPSCTKIVQDGITSFKSYWHCFIASTADTDGDGVINDQDTLRSHTDDH